MWKDSESRKNEELHFSLPVQSGVFYVPGVRMCVNLESPCWNFLHFFFFCLLSPSVVCTTSSHTVTLQRVSSFGQLYENVKTQRRWGEVQRKTSHLPRKRICNSAARSPNYMGLCWSLHKTRAKRERRRQNVRKGEERRVRRQAGGGLPHFINTEFTSQSCSELMLTKQRHSCSF